MYLIVYEDMNLSDLRRYAKKFGVKSPTKYKKKELIEKIIKVKTGEEQPYFEQAIN